MRWPLTLPSPRFLPEVCDWDHWERLVAHGVASMLGARSEEHPIMVSCGRSLAGRGRELDTGPLPTPQLVEPCFNDRDSRYKMAEMLFETFHTPAAFLAKDAALAWCAQLGRVDCPPAALRLAAPPLHCGSPHPPHRAAL